MAGFSTGLKFEPFIATHHSITGHVITIEGDHAIAHAHAHAHVRAERWVPDEVAAAGPNRWLVVGFYDNEAVRSEHGWRSSKVSSPPPTRRNTQLLSRAGRR